MSNKANILYINLFKEKDNINYSLSLTSQINNQDTKSDCIDVFIYDQSNESIIKLIQQYDIYAQRYDINVLHKAAIRDVTTTDIFKPFCNYHTYVFLLNTEIVLPKNLSTLVYNHSLSNPIFSLYNNESIFGIVVDKNFLYSLIIENNSINRLYVILDEASKQAANRLTTQILGLKPYEKSINNSTMVQNEYFIFFQTPEDKTLNLKESYVYANKRNNKAYNINNNTIGYIVSYENDIIDILWPTSNEPKSYRINTPIFKS